MSHIAIASGGTGGHFYPTLAIAEAALESGHGITLFVAGHHADDQLAIARERGFTAVKLPAVRLPRSATAAAAFPFRFTWSLLRAGRALGRIRPDVVLGMGSFASIPLGLSAVLRRVPLVLHEGNSLMGRANRILSRWARVAATSLPLAENHRPRCPTVRTGMPLRKALLRAAETKEPPAPELYAAFGLAPGTPTVLVFGGSQGARVLNRVVPPAFLELAEKHPGLRIVHQSGVAEYAAVRAAYEAAGDRAEVVDFINDIGARYAAADLVIARAGALTLAELTALGKPAILVPFPHAAHDHQSFNARALVRAGAAEMIPEDGLDSGKLADKLEKLIVDGDRRRQMAAAARSLARLGAREKIVDHCLKLLAEKGSKNG